jgi:plastocyanin
MNRSPTRPVLALCFVLAAASPLPADEPPPPPAAPVTAESGADGIQRATIILDSYSYAPNHLIVQAGKPVELTLTSVTTIVPHNFILKEPAAGLDIEKDISSGKTDKVTFTPTQTGTFTFYCDRRLWPMPSHRNKGMEGKLEVR